MTPVRAQRDSYIDLLRIGALCAVVLGHWLLVDISYRDGRVSGTDAMSVIGWAGWVTLALQVMPVFFLVGGWVNARSWQAHSARGESWGGWLHGRVVRLSWPTTVYLLAVAAATEVAVLTHAPADTVAAAGWLLCEHLWFLPTYLAVTAATPIMLAAHRRWGWWVSIVMALTAGGVDIILLAGQVTWVGYLNYAIVWAAMHQWGIAWQAGAVPRSSVVLGTAASAGVLALALLVGPGPFPIDMIGTTGAVSNTGPPSIALLTFAAVQGCLVLLLRPSNPVLRSNLDRWRTLQRVQPWIMQVYLWHMVPVVVVAITLYPTLPVPQPGIGSVRWWALRPLWIAVLGVGLTATLWTVATVQRGLPRPGGYRRGRWAALRTVIGAAAMSAGRVRLAIAGVAPDGTLAVVALAAYGGGATLVATATSRSPHPPSRPQSTVVPGRTT